jgi:MFS family permease
MTGPGGGRMTGPGGGRMTGPGGGRMSGTGGGRMTGPGGGRMKGRGDGVVVGSTDRLITMPFVIVTVSVFVLFIYIGILAPVLPLFIERELGGGEFGLGLNVAVFSIAAIAARPALGRLADRYGRRALMVGGATLCGVSGVAIAFTSTMVVLLGLRVIAGFGEAAIFVGGATLVADLAPPERRAEAASYFSVAVFGGLGIGPIIGESVLDDVFYERAFALAGAAAITAAVIATLAPRRVVSAEVAAGRRQPRPARTFTGWRKLVHPDAVLPGVVLACAVFALAAFLQFIPDYSRSVGMGSSAGLYTLYAGVSLLVRIVGAKMPERLGARRAVTTALSLLAAGMLVLAVWGTVPGLWVGTLLLGLGVAFNYPSLMALTVNRVDDAERAAVVSSFTMFFEVGTVTGGLVLGPLAEVVGKQNSFYAAAVVCVLGIWVLRTFVTPRRPAHVPVAV